MFKKIWKWFVRTLYLVCMGVLITACVSNFLNLLILRNNVLNLQREQAITRAYFNKVVTSYSKNLIVNSNQIQAVLKNNLKNLEYIIQLDANAKENMIESNKNSIGNLEFITALFKLTNETIEDLKTFEKQLLPESYEYIKGSSYLIINFRQNTEGSGTVIKLNNKHYILTCAHLFKKETDIMVAQNSNSKQVFNTELVSIDWANDLALLRIDLDETYPVMEIGTIAPVPGQEVHIFGNPGDYNDILTSGIIAKCGETQDLVTAPIFFGSSGGGVFYKEKLVGVVQSLSFSISAFELKDPNLRWFEIPKEYLMDIRFGKVANLKTIMKFLEGCKEKLKGNYEPIK